MAGGDPAESSTDLAKLGLEVMYRVGKVTPITPTSVLSIALLSADGDARSIGELVTAVQGVDRLITELGLPVTERIDTELEVTKALGLLAEHGNVSSFAGTETVYYLSPEQALRASYYRNISAHHFLPRAITEMALSALGDGGLDEDRFWEEVAVHRDLLKFEFIFPNKEDFQQLIVADLDRIAPDWREGTVTELHAKLVPTTAPWVAAPFLEAYLVVADELNATDGPVTDEKSFLAACLRRGGEYRLKGLVRPEIVSGVLFQQALELARNRHLLEEEQGRPEFSAELRKAISGAGNHSS